MSAAPPSHATAIDLGEESPLWARTAPAAGVAIPLRGEVEADVGIVGAGFLGLSTALHLAEAGARVAVIEAQEPGAGASGRNTGFVIPTFPTPKGPDEAVAAFGEEAGAWLSGRVGAAADFAFDLAARLGIDCEQDRLGWAQAAHSVEMLGPLAAIARAWERRGFPVEVLGRASTAALLGFDLYPGCIVFRRGGQLNPLAYVRGLARAAEGAGVLLRTRSPVLDIARSKNGWAVRTPSGSLQAREVVVTANVATLGLVGDGAPIRVAHMRQAATAPLPPTAAYRGPRMPFSDTAPHPNFALRTTRDGRLVTGGDPDLASRRLAAILPPGQSVAIDYTWGGDTAHTDTMMPRLNAPRPGLFEAVACNGRGVAFTSAFGAMVADYLARPDGDARLMARLTG